MKRFHRTLGLAIGIIATIAFFWYASQALRGEDLSRYTSTRSLLAIAIAAFFYASIIPISAWAWQRLLHGLNIERPWRELTEIMAITQIAKYVPGNVGVHLGRAGMAMAKGIPSRPLVISIIVETVLAVAAALVVGLTGVALSSPDSRILIDEFRSLLWLAGLLVIATIMAAVLLRFLASPLLNRFAPQHSWLLSSEMTPKVSNTIQAFSAYTANYLFIGIGISLMGYVMLPEIAHSPALLCASFALAWVAGFFTPGAPAGLGVREGLMLVILSTSYAKADAIVIIIALRLATMLGDSILLLTGYAFLLTSRKQANATSTP